jgi:hypothetical protein
MKALAAPGAAEVEQQLAAEVGKYYEDPYGFVMFAYPWGTPGSVLEHEAGPDEIQKTFLKDIGKEVKKRGFNGFDPVMPIRMTETSGHGTGKSAMGAWIADWILSTRPHSIGTITAGTYDQLKARTWAAIRYWTRLCCTAHWFEIQQESVHHKDHPDSWKIVAQTCKEENAQNFAGQHAARSTSWYLLDEASQVPDKIWETAEGGLTDGEPHIYAWGQPVRNTGEFYKINFGSKKARWNHRRIDSRKSRFTNKPLIDQWIADYGIDSDWVKVRVLGLPPSADELQYIDQKRVDLAKLRAMQALSDDPLVAGFDVSGGGRAWNVIRFRRGLDGNPLPAIRIPGDADADRSRRLALCAELLSDKRPEHHLAALFIDTAFGAPIASRLQAMGFDNVFEVNFGGESPDVHCLNKRAFMWMKAKDWLLLGGLPPQDEELAAQLCLPGYHINSAGKLVIESKQSLIERGEASPDDADAFCLTFASNVVLPARTSVEPPHVGVLAGGGTDGGWMG